MMTIKIETDEQWHKVRRSGIGGSEAAAIIGKSPYMSNVDLWKIKTGREKPKDISGKACVAYGHAAEAPLRELFALDYPQYAVSYLGAYDVVRNKDYPFILATLDGRLEEKDTGRLGIYEGKTTEFLNSSARLKWDDRIPDNYYIQLLHQMLATGWDFAVLNAQIKKSFGGEIRTETRRYKIERADVEEDLEYLLAEELKFWNCVREDIEPPLKLPDIF